MLSVSHACCLSVSVVFWPGFYLSFRYVYPSGLLSVGQYCCLSFRVSVCRSVFWSFCQGCCLSLSVVYPSRMSSVGQCCCLSARYLTDIQGCLSTRVVVFRSRLLFIGQGCLMVECLWHLLTRQFPNPEQFYATQNAMLSGHRLDMTNLALVKRGCLQLTMSDEMKNKITNIHSSKYIGQCRTRLLHTQTT